MRRAPAYAHLDMAKPYGLFGLCLSLIALLFITPLYATLIEVIASSVMHGWQASLDFMKQAAAGFAALDFGAVLNLIVNDALKTFSYLTISVFVYCALCLAILTLARIRGGAAWRSLIAWWPWSPRRAGRAYWFIAGFTLLYSFAANAAIAYFYPPAKEWFSVPHGDLSAAILLFVLAAVFAPIAEELLFRGWIYTSLRASFSAWIAILITSLIFAGLHYEDTHIYALAVFPVGVALGALRETAGSLKASISFHAFFNAVAYGLAALDLG